MTSCKPVQSDTGEYVCSVCGWGVGKGVMKPFHRQCGIRRPETPREGRMQSPDPKMDRASARREACLACPNWSREGAVCTIMTSRPCVMRGWWNGDRQICNRWPE